MGKLREIVRAADISKDVCEEVRDSLHVLLSLTDSKLKLFQDEFNALLKSGKAADSLTVPVKKCVGTYAEARAITPEQPTDLLQNVSETIGSMFSDHSATEIVAGMAKIATQTLKALLGAGMGSEQEARMYMVVPDRPAIVRYDFGCWNRMVKGAAIREHCQSALACVIYKSEVDVSKVSFDDFLAVYAPVLNAAVGSNPSKLQEMVIEAKKTYDQSRQDSHANRDAEPLDMDSAMKIVASHVKPQGIVLSAPKKAAVGDF